MKQRWLFLALLVGTILLAVASCSFTTERPSAQDLSGRMLLWHSLDTVETEALYQVIQSFTALYPAVSVKVQVFSTTVELNQQFINSAAAGLGPDLLLAPSSMVQPLAAVHTLAPIDQYVTEAVTERFNPAILATLTLNGELYGLPQSLDTLGLYVNRQLVENPATDLSTLLNQANSGTTVLVPINFSDAFWGIRAFGGQLFNEEGMTVLDQGGFANWLAWLRDARNAPGMIQDTNRDVLRQRFMSGNAGYYIGYASELNEILAVLDPAIVDVLPLPNGPVGQAGPLVTSQAFLFSRVSSSNQRLLAAELAKFVTNVEQSSRLMRLARDVPANINVRINPRLYPIVASFVGQARNGIPRPMRDEFAAVTRLGNEAYVRTLEGGESPADVAFAVNNAINVANGFEVQDAPSYACSNLGTLRLLHNWQEANATAALNEVIADFQRVCPLIIVDSQSTTSSQMVAAMTGASGTRHSTTVALVNQLQLAELLGSAPALMNLDNLISAETLQRFAPIAVEAMRDQGNLYGLPLTVGVDALYYRSDMVATPAQTLDDLRAQAAAGVPISLDTTFARAFWGLRAFGTQLFAPSGAAILDQGGMAGWLIWLRESRDTYGIQLTEDSEAVLRRFLNGESAYYVGGANELADLREALGDDLSVTFLPNGPGGPAQPLVYVEGLSMRADTSEVYQSLALDLMRFATNAESQNRLMVSGDRIPANGNVSPADNPFFSVFFEQAQTGYLLPTTEIWQTMADLGAEAYAAVLDEGQDATVVVRELTAAINHAYGIVVTPTPTAEPAPVPEVAPEDDGSTPATPAPGAEDADGSDGESDNEGTAP